MGDITGDEDGDEGWGWIWGVCVIDRNSSDVSY